MKIPAILFVCLAVTEFVQQAPKETPKEEWGPWVYVETRRNVELHWRRHRDLVHPRIQFGFKNRNPHDVEIRFVEHGYIHADGTFDPQSPSSLVVPAGKNLARKPDELKRSPKSWNLTWEVRRKG